MEKPYTCAYCKEATDNSDLLCDACDAENTVVEEAPTPDVEINGRTGFYTFTSISDKAKTWVAANVDRASWNGGPGFFSVDSFRLSGDIADGMVEAGLRVEFNGQPYSGSL